MSQQHFSPSPSPPTNTDTPSTQAEKHSTPLHQACKTGDLDVIQQHISADSDLNVRDWRGATPLIICAEDDQFSAAKLLLSTLSPPSHRHPLDLGVRYGEGSTVLHAASISHIAELIALLLEEGVDIDEKTDVGWTPLHLAALFDRVENVKLLIGRGANVGIGGPDGKGVLDVAVENGSEGVIGYLQSLESEKARRR